MTVLVAQLGARRYYAVPRALHRRGLLERLVTDLCAETPLLRVLQASIPGPARTRKLASLFARRAEGLPNARIATLPAFALSPWQARRGGEALTDHWARRNCDFCREVVRRGFRGAQAVYAFNGAALEIFEAAKKRGLATVLDQTAAPWRWNSAMLREEVRRWPGWEDQPGELDASGLLSEREEREWDLADRVVCGSAFAAAALAEHGGPRDHLAVVPYAGDAAASGDGMARPARSGPLRVLFVGTLQLRKGVQYLHAAGQLLKGENIQIRLVGPSLLSAQAMKDIACHTEIVGAVARAEVDRHFAWADVLVLPTLSEGAANVCAEAIARGVPVITTANAGSAVEHGRNGLIVPVRDAVSLATAIARLAQDTTMRESLAQNCLRSRGGASFEVYAEALARVVTAPRRVG